jgi:hypothetical protein
MSQPEGLDPTEAFDDEPDLEAPDADVAEQTLSVDPSWAGAEVSTDPEAPEWDAAEQALSVDSSWTGTAVSTDLEAPEWDAYEQSQVVQLEDDYR